MVGRYPYCDPLGDYPSKEDGRRHLRKMLEVSITAFVCMQAEIPSPAPENLKAWPWEGVSLPAAGQCQVVFLVLRLLFLALLLSLSSLL